MQYFLPLFSQGEGEYKVDGRALATQEMRVAWRETMSDMARSVVVCLKFFRAFRHEGEWRTANILGTGRNQC